MIPRLAARLRKLRRAVSRTEWAVRLLGLPRSTGTASEPGLILIQIDGLGHDQFRRALRYGRLPFIARLLNKEGYRLCSWYSGMPSTTPAVQGELFYGVKCAVPAFQFRDHETGELNSMLDADAASRVEERLAREGEPLLADGSAYSNVYTGGAARPHFCSAAMGLGGILKHARPLTLLVVLLMNLTMAIRMAVLAVVELVLAVTDMFRGIIAREDLLKELTFVPSRVGVCILLRELLTMGVRTDAARGVPIIHCNLLGYDEQAHRRGPRSRFAQWTLKGIDRAIKNIWKTAQRSRCRTYDIWIYSDHGQEYSEDYPTWTGRTIHKAVEAAFAKHGVTGRRAQPLSAQIQLRRFNLLGGRRAQRLLGRSHAAPPPADVEVAAMGPVAHVYAPEPLSDAQKAAVAQELAREGQVPLVMTKDDAGEITAWTGRGAFPIPKRMDEAVGAGHPFLEQLREDLPPVVRHPDAGGFVLFGWRPTGQPATFAVENGAHGGPGVHETRGFAAIPGDIEVAGNAEASVIRPLDLRHAALHFLGRKDRDEEAAPAQPRRAQRFRVMTYNVHSCMGMDGKHSPERIARVIAHYSPDVVALQELDVGRLRTGEVDQAQLIADRLAMEYHFHPSFIVEEERYGNAILSRFPMRLVKADGLPGPIHLEPRGAIWVELEIGGRRVQLITTHLGLRAGEQRDQIACLMGREWMGGPDCVAPLILCGDFNARPGSRVMRRALQRLADLHLNAAAHRRPGKTWMRMRRIDYVLGTEGIEGIDAIVPNAHLARTASDHRPLIVDLALRPDGS